MKSNEQSDEERMTLPRILAYAVDSKTAAQPFDGRLGLTVPGYVVSLIIEIYSKSNHVCSVIKGLGRRRVSASKLAIKLYDFNELSLPQIH